MTIGNYGNRLTIIATFNGRKVMYHYSIVIRFWNRVSYVRCWLLTVARQHHVTWLKFETRNVNESKPGVFDQPVGKYGNSLNRASHFPNTSVYMPKSALCHQYFHHPIQNALLEKICCSKVSLVNQCDKHSPEPIRTTLDPCFNRPCRLKKTTKNSKIL